MCEDRRRFEGSRVRELDRREDPLLQCAGPRDSLLLGLLDLHAHMHPPAEPCIHTNKHRARYTNKIMPALESYKHKYSFTKANK